VAAGGAPYAVDYAADRGHVWHEGAFIYFRAADTLGASPDSITLFHSDTLRAFAPVDRAIAGNACDSCRFLLTGALDSLRLPDTTADRLLEARRSSDTAAFAAVAFSIVDYAGPLRKLDNPYIILRVNVMKGYNDSTKVQDTIRSRALRYTVFESLRPHPVTVDSAKVERAEAELRASELYSSYYAKRTAVFKVNMSRVFDSLSSPKYGGKWDGGKWELLSAVVSFRHNSAGRDTTDKLGFSTRNPPGKYKALVLDTCLEAEFPNSENPTDAEKSRLLYYSFANAGSTAPAMPYNTHPFKAVMRSVMEKYGNSKRENESYKPYIYVYMRPVDEGSVILWEHTIKVELVFTPSRSRRGTQSEK
jgi:hypothetical protein